MIAVVAGSVLGTGQAGVGAFEPEAAAAVARPWAHVELVVGVRHAVPIRRWPGAGRVLGWMPATSRYFHQPIAAWVLRRSGRFGRVPVPYTAHRRAGWIDLRGLALRRTRVRVEADLSRHVLVVRRRGVVVVRVRTATGAPSSPTPPGRYFVTDRTPFSLGGPYGSFAFGISGIQTRLPAGWSGGDQLAIHGTNDPGSIGRSASAGCLRVSEWTLRRLKPLLRLGTPVVIRA
ncbi:MAG: L,D-transpeptidase [Actinobacteria bacterium]|nr:L,D-transpeptidase [Actinomycetota bacterium]